MEYDLSKDIENICPRRGGRNVTQLEVALRAQNDSGLQRELMEQKEAFEEAIRIYEGDDPLDNWYNFVIWVEQSYPKHGHEGNLIPLLEDCLSKFENDERYVHDRRLCKLWIKYIDLQQNPLELFQLLYSKGICVSCADLYRAWAFYHEIAGDYKKADAVFQLGLRGHAEPYRELILAQENMFMAIGREAIQGVDETRRVEERRALTSLVSYSHNQRTMAPNVRIGNNVLNSNPGVLPQNVQQGRNSNAPVTLYEDLEVAGPSIGACASVSVLEVARKQEVIHKENSLKPGNWQKGIKSAKKAPPRKPSFEIHEDEDPAYAGGIRLPPDFARQNFDDFSDWITDLYYPEPEDDTKIPMYPKNLVYGTGHIEFSPEEIRARKWFEKKKLSEAETMNTSSITMQETVMEEANIITANPQHHRMNAEIEEAVQSILPSDEAREASLNMPQNNDSFDVPRYSFFPQNITAYEQETSVEQLQTMSTQSGVQPRVSVYQDHQLSSQYNRSQAHASQNASYYHGAHTSKLPQASTSQLANYSQHHSDQNREVLGAAAPIQQWPNSTMISDENYTQNTCDTMKSINEIWKDSLTQIADPPIHIPLQKPEPLKFQIHEDTVLREADRQRQESSSAENRNSNSKLPLSTYEEPENDNKRVPQQNLGPGGNPTMGYRKPARESLRSPFSSQPLPEPDLELPRKTPSYSEPLCDDKFVRPAEINKNGGFVIFEDNALGLITPNMNDSCTTQQFNFNLKSQQVSTPFNYKKVAAQQYANATVFGDHQEPAKSSKKLFEELEETPREETRQQDVLSVILETTKEYRNSSSSGNSSSSTNMLKTTTFHRESLKAIPESSCTYEESVQEYHQQISQNVSLKEINNTNINNYDIVKMQLKMDSPVVKSCLPPVKSPMNFIDLTGDDSIQPRQSVYRFSEIGGGDSMQTQQKIQKSVMNNYESPMKHQFREMSCDSNDSLSSLSSSPAKGHKMDVDLNSSQNSNYEYNMEHDSEPFDETILQKVPSDPFNNKIIAALLRKVGFPNQKHSRQYIEMQSLPRLTAKKEVVTFVNDKYMVEKVIGKGAFGCVYKATNVNTGEMVALKYQKPPNKWEYYIIKEIQARCNPYMVTAYMDVNSCYISRSASVLASEFFKFGSLLDLANNVKKVTGKRMKEIISIYYASEIITIVDTLHKCNIIHADIKPDNFLVTRIPPEYGYPSLQLIDFGNSIDMSLFAKGTTFRTVVSTENFICTEMKDGRPWTYQTDIFCIAATVHVLLLDKYMQLQKNGSVWSICQHIPRYLRQDFWKTFFFQMLNIKSCDQLPELIKIKSSFDQVLSAQNEELQMEMRLVANHVLGK